MYLTGNDRRKFLAVLGAAGASMLPGCAFIDHRRYPAFFYYRDSNRLIVDSHCHIMNQHDGNLDFVDRHVLEANRVLPVTRIVGDFMARLLAYVNWGFAMTVEDEITWIKSNMTTMQLGPAQFYEIVDKGQGGILRAPQFHPMSGFFSNRTRNAARLIFQFPQVDIFTPAMVDFYEGNCSTYSRPDDLVEYYKLLNIASNGRFLPLAPAATSNSPTCGRVKFLHPRRRDRVTLFG